MKGRETHMNRRKGCGWKLHFHGEGKKKVRGLGKIFKSLLVCRGFGVGRRRETWGELEEAWGG